jgi:DNA-binding transcriptional LysR family regulator
MQAGPLDTLRGFYVFAQVAETGSFSRAAERLTMTRSAVSKHIQQLEGALGVQLIVRTTRKLVLTEAGERVFTCCSRIAGDVEAARDAAQDQRLRIAGKLRVTAPVALTGYLMPAVTAFMQQNVELEVDLVFDDAFIDLIAERIDIALRVGGAQTETSFVSRRIAPVEIVIAAAPAYLAQHGQPRTASELSTHEWLMHTPSNHDRTVTLRKGRQRVVLRQHGRLSCNSGPSSMAAALAGLGLFIVPDFEVARELKAGTLVRLLPNWTIEQRSLQLVFPPRRHVPGRVRAFADFLAEHFRGPPWK